MDMNVTPDGPGRWTLVDLLGRELGELTELAPEDVRIKPGARAGEAMRTMKLGPYANLDAALSAIETHTRGTCRMAAGSSVTSKEKTHGAD